MVANWVQQVSLLKHSKKTVIWTTYVYVVFQNPLCIFPDKHNTHKHSSLNRYDTLFQNSSLEKILPFASDKLYTHLARQKPIRNSGFIECFSRSKNSSLVNNQVQLYVTDLSRFHVKSADYSHSGHERSKNRFKSQTTCPIRQNRRFLRLRGGMVFSCMANNCITVSFNEFLRVLKLQLVSITMPKLGCK